LVTAFIATACTDGSTDRAAPPPTPSPAASGQSTLCRPFPDKLVDDFMAAYNGRNASALEEIVAARDIEDVVATAYSGDESFDDVGDWARASWDAGDRIRSLGYSHQPAKGGFGMMIARTSEPLRDAGIERVSAFLRARTDDCVVTSLESAGPVQAEGDPCAFYEAFAGVETARPKACADGSARFARSAPAVAPDGRRAFVWGGSRGGYFTFGDMAMDGVIVHPRSGRARVIEAPELPAFRPEASAWTGAELIVLGSKTRGDQRVVGAAYDPAGRSWRRIEFPYGGWTGFEGVWTGSELVLWGGPEQSRGPRSRGAAYDPATRTWRRTSPAPIGGRWSHAAVWTGSEMIVWGGTDSRTDLADGAAYDPVADSWRTIAPAPISPRQWMPAAWTGREVVLWGGSTYSRSRADGAAYDPVADAWRKLAPAPIEGRHRHSATWTGREVVVFGGYDYRRSFANGAAYDPVADRWRKLPRPPVKARFDHGAAWTGSGLLVFGGTWSSGHIALGDGALYDPGKNRWRRLVPDP
jgi:hypothetical protein